jgi:NADH dehydrogenase (ubiquinone) Fe-S protein 1
MCLVEIAGAPKPVAACAAQISDGMKIVTQSEVTRNARGGVMEFLLANHPLDCPICDQGGECDLQDISVVYGYKKGRFKEYKRAVEDKNLGPLIATVMNRCIHCTRCIRFSEEIMGVFDLGTIGRGRSTEIGTYIEKFVSNELSGNLIDLCPVGALTNGPYAYTSRPWELTSVDTIDLMDGLGSNIQVDARGAEIMRVLPRIHEEINEEWISDKSRFSYDGLKKQRLTVPLKRNKDGTFEELTWQEALETVAKKMNDVQGSEMSAIIGNFADVESIIALKDMLNRLDCDNFEIRSDAPKLNADLRSSYIMNSRISGIEDSDLILLVGVNPKTENPVLNARILKAAKRGAKVAIIGTSADMGYEYIHLGNTTRSLIDIAEGKHPFAARLNTAKLPMVILGSRALERKDGEGILAAVKTIANNSNVLNEKEGWNGFNILHHEGSRCGALDVGISSNTDPNFKPKFVYILGADNIRTEDIPEDAFVVYQGTHGDEGAYFADIILPGAAYTEKSATFVNTEGRVQVSRLVVQPPGIAKEDWKIIRALSEEVGQSLPYDNHEEVVL